MVRAAGGIWSCAGGFAVFGGRVEQHRVHGGGSEESQARRSAFDGFWNRDCDYAVLPGESGVSVRAAAGADSERSGRPGGDGGAFGDFWSERRAGDGGGDHHFYVWLQQWIDSGGLARGLCDGEGRIVLPGHGNVEP